MFHICAALDTVSSVTVTVWSCGKPHPVLNPGNTSLTNTAAWPLLQIANIVSTFMPCTLNELLSTMTDLL